MKESATTILFEDEDIINLRENRCAGLFLVPIVEIEDGWIKHVNCEGAHFHVLSWGTRGRRCSEPKCIINKPKEKEDEHIVINKIAYPRGPRGLE